MEVRSKVTADTYIRNFGLWLEYLNLDPDGLIDMAKNHFEEFRGKVADKIRELEAKGVMGSSISTSTKPMISFLKYKNVVVRLGINIRNENRNLKAESEVIPSPEELSRVLRMATLRERVAISLMAFSGLRPEVLGNIDGTDGLTLKDIPDLKIINGKVEFANMPVRIIVRHELSKIRQPYFTFLGNQGSEYLKEYIESRLEEIEKLKKEKEKCRKEKKEFTKEIEELTKDSPVILPVEKQSLDKKNKFLMTTLLLRRIKATIVKAGFNWRPYIFRIYFGTNLDTAEAKGMISHPWRQYIMGHKGDIEETYTKREGKIDEGRDQYAKCLKFLETDQKGMSEEDIDRKFRLQLLMMAGFNEAEIKDKNLLDMNQEEITKLARDRLFGGVLNTEDVVSEIRNIKKTMKKGSQKVIPISLLESYINEGFSVKMALGNDKAIVELP